MSVEVIAEVGVNHDGNFSLACDLVDQLSNVGTDVIKFQSFSAADLVTDYGHTANYQRVGKFQDSSQYEMLSRLELSLSQFCDLKQRCEHMSMEFMSTPFSIQWLDSLVGLGMRRIKIPSGEVTNIPYIEYVGSVGLPVIMSTGMCNLLEVQNAMEALLTSGLNLSAITLLHCTSNYPARIEDANLRSIKTLQTEFGCKVGYSDHCESMLAACVAVTLGATMIERHVTYNCDADGPDHRSSLDVSQFSNYVASIRETESLLGSPDKVPAILEVETAVVARKSIVAARDLSPGTIITADSLAYKRPGNGLSPAMFKELIGRTLTTGLAKDEQICLDHIK
jgi:N,N'-diacetyllegionaminate synthase